MCACLITFENDPKHRHWCVSSQTMIVLVCILMCALSLLNPWPPSTVQLHLLSKGGRTPTDSPLKHSDCPDWIFCPFFGQLFSDYSTNYEWNFKILFPFLHVATLKDPLELIPFQHFGGKINTKQCLFICFLKMRFLKNYLSFCKALLL